MPHLNPARVRLFPAFVAVCVLLVLLLGRVALAAQAPVYDVLWFDTEDYIDPSADDAALRIATDLSRAGVRATFKVVGEKARVLEARGRNDVIRALGRHTIGYHSNFHSLQPTPSVYLERMGLLEGAAEFERREAAGVSDLKQIFGVFPICYGQPGSSWGPQAYLALRRMGIPVYLDEGIQVGINHQPFWFGGLLNIYNMGPYSIRPDLLDHKGKSGKAEADVVEAVRRLQRQGGGVLSTMFHPTEFVTTEFWDAVNFREGAVRERDQWKPAQARTAVDSEQCYRSLNDFVQVIQKAGVQFVTAEDMLQLYRGPVPPPLPVPEAAAMLQQHISFQQTASGEWSAADLLLAVLGMKPQIVDGPSARGVTSYHASSIPYAVFTRSKADVVSYINTFHRLPSEAFVGAETLSLSDFAATVAAATEEGDSPVRVEHGQLAFEQYFSNDAEGAFRWPIHPKGFFAPQLLELARLQGWTLKPAHLR